MTSTPGSYYLYPGTPSPDWWNAPSNPMSIGAGTSEQGYGWGVPSFGAAPIQIRPEYLDYLSTAPGFIPGSGTYNQWDLSRPGLLGTVAGQEGINLRYGQGGTGDPTNGLEPQTPQEWVSGPKLFTSTRTSNWGQGDQAGTGLDYIATTFLRSDTPSGINTSAWGAPDAYWKGLAQQIAAGQIQPTARGWQLLQEKGYTPQTVGGAAPAQAAAVASGAGGTGGTGSTQNALGSIAASQAADQAARLAYTQWQMRTGDEQLAMQKAQQAWTQTFQEQQARTQALGTFDGQDTLAKLNQEFSQRMQQSQLELSRAGLLGTLEGQKTLAALNQEYQQRVQEAGLTGQWNGQQTQQAQQQAWAQRNAEQQQQASNSLALLGLQAGMQGPRDAFRYAALNANTPGGLQQMLAGFAGQYGFAGSGYQGTPGPATLQSRTQDLLSGGQLGSGGQQQMAQPSAGATPQQNGYALPAPNQISLANYQNASPSQREMLLGAYENQGYWGTDVEEAIRRSAPRFAGPTGAQVSLG